MLKGKKIIKIMGIGSLCLFLLGCSRESFLVQEEISEILSEEDSSTGAAESMSNAKDSAAVAGSASNAKDSEGTAVKESGNAVEIAVHICGAVNQPGVYYLKENQRVCDAIDKAGGFREDADPDYLNQALILEDGMKIDVPTREEAEQMKAQEEISEEAQSGKIDLNTADEARLCTLPGIGESRAKSIIAYREAHGNFQTPEDIMKVSGIKEAAYEKIKDYVTVSN